jgi:hypothetical protein
MNLKWSILLLALITVNALSAQNNNNVKGPVFNISRTNPHQSGSWDPLEDPAVPENRKIEAHASGITFYKPEEHTKALSDLGVVLVSLEKDEKMAKAVFTLNADVSQHKAKVFWLHIHLPHVYISPIHLHLKRRK